MVQVDVSSHFFVEVDSANHRGFAATQQLIGQFSRLFPIQLVDLRGYQQSFQSVARIFAPTIFGYLYLGGTARRPHRPQYTT